MPTSYLFHIPQNLIWKHIQLATTKLLFFLNWKEYRHCPMWIFQSLVTKSVIVLDVSPCPLSSCRFMVLIHFSCLGLQCLLPPSIHYALSLYFNISIFTCSFSSDLIFHIYLPLKTNNLPCLTSLYHSFLSSCSQQTFLKGLYLC